MDWRGVFAKCLESTALIEPRGSDLVLPGDESTKLTVTGWSQACVAIRIRGGKRGGVDHVRGLRKDRGLERRADYILFVSLRESNYAVILEMKRSLRSRDPRAYEQVRATRPIVAYLESLAWNVGCRCARVVLRHIVVGSESGDRIPKQAPRARPSSVGSRWRAADIEGTRFIAEELPLTWLVADPRQWEGSLEEDHP